MGGFMLHVDGEPRATLEPDQLLQFVREGSVDIPDITEADINGRSKGDGLSKCVAILQLVWFVIQLIARYAQNLPVTLLEIDTLAVATLTCIAYGLWWKKPKDIGRPHIVYWNSEVTAPPLRGSFAQDSRSIYRHLLRVVAPSLSGYSDSGLSRDSSPTMISFIIGGVSGMIFGGIHCLGWNFLFPRHAEQILWRAASVGMVYAPLMTFFISIMVYMVDMNNLVACRWIWDKMPPGLQEIIKMFGILLGSLAVNFYYFGRITTVVLMMLSLRSLPAGAYDTVAWTKFIPHVNL
ncbi:hypothetical protein EDB19DRAFT_2026907 [Suillus lakei]|nr:hypothetical protein EDB19DRAFT_2026907 [Suillus lakei]